MTSRERVLKAINHEEADRVPIHDGPWGTTIARWQEEGLPEGVSANAHFGYEFWGSWCDNSLQLPTEVLEDTDEYSIAKTGDGNVWSGWTPPMAAPWPAALLRVETGRTPAQCNTAWCERHSRESQISAIMASGPVTKTTLARLVAD